MALKNLKEIETEFENTKDLVEYILRVAPDTRDNDTALYIYCCAELGCKTFQDIIKLNLNVTTIHRIRRLIQNNEGRYLPSEKTQKKRKKRERNIKEYMITNGR